MTVNIF